MQECFKGPKPCFAWWNGLEFDERIIWGAGILVALFIFLRIVYWFIRNFFPD